MENLRERFAERIEETNRECRESCYPPTGFEQMLENKHAVELAKALVMSGKFHTGLKRLIREGRPDIRDSEITIIPFLFVGEKQAPFLLRPSFVP